MTPNRDAMSLARCDTAKARARLEAIYGRVPPVVAFVQREDGPVEIVRALRLVGTVHRLLLADPTPLAIRAVVPGGQALEHWFRRQQRKRDWDGAQLVTFAQAFGDAHGQAFATTGDMGDAGVAALRELDPFLADFERLYHNGATHVQLASMTELSEGEVRMTVDRMRALGFDMPHRRVYARRRA